MPKLVPSQLYFRRLIKSKEALFPSLPPILSKLPHPPKTRRILEILFGKLKTIQLSLLNKSEQMPFYDSQLEAIC